MKKALLFLFGAALPLLMAASGGGFPSRPRFQAVGVGSVAPTVAGSMRVGSSTFQESSGADGSLSVAGTTQSSLYMREDDAPANEKNWRWAASAGDLYLLLYDDAQSGSTNPIFVTRTGTTVDRIDLTATAVRVNGSNVCTADGTNCPGGSSLIICATACSVATLPVGGVALVRKPSDTTRTSTATSALDPDLQLTSMPAGTYTVDAFILANVAATGNGFRFQWAGGTIGAGNSCRGDTGASLPSTAFIEFGMAGSDVSSTTWPGNTSNSALICRGAYTGGSSLGLLWAQGTSAANNTTIKAGSWIRIQRIT